MMRCSSVCLVAALFVAGCGSQAPPRPEGVSDVAERGPLTLTVSVYPKEVLLGDPITVELLVHTPDDYVVEFPPGDEALSEWTLRDEDAPDPRPGVEGGLDWRRTYTVDSFTSGTREIPPLVAKYARRPDDAGEKPVFESELASGSLAVEIRSALTTQDSVNQPRDITETLTPPIKLTRTQWWLIAAVVAGALLLAYVIYRLIRRARSRPVPVILPEVWAMRALAELGATEWIETGRAREYYYGLSEIVRSYIERKFSLAAPEMTTEEFLVTLARDRSALPYDAEKLRAFLESCDIVKYAAFAPRKEDGEEAMGTARAFVNSTAAAAARTVATHVGASADEAARHETATHGATGGRAA